MTRIEIQDINVNRDEKPDVVVLLDESGSMYDYRAAVVETFNEYVQSVKDTANTVSLFTFDSRGIRRKLFRVDPSEAPKFTEADYCPNAMTPLYDSMGIVMKEFEGNDRNVQFVTHTDGYENTSTEWTFEKLDKYIEKLTAKGWLFVYLGEGLSGKEALQSFSGLKMNYSPANRANSIKAMAASTVAYAATGATDAAAYTSSGGDEIDVDSGEQVVVNQ